ncbi:unnamed protein product [Ostreobium quekettii]|uniref:Uncharacterized protein n=1 Tax=Ostreobium quekettii TaxID=121088 RepID=A0A8S1J3J8_9CHLO|nr:unnamed protein product [Ostreobium quekettii]|eukprot:evm.model.scf_726.3 EVM.evm.TU.scf_726.3   scf_726:17010-27503(+)
MGPARALHAWAWLWILLLCAAACGGARVRPSEAVRRRLLEDTALGSPASEIAPRLGLPRIQDPLSSLDFSVALPNELQIARKLRQAAEDKNEMLLDAAGDGDVDEVKQLLEDGADVNTTDASGNTPLILGTADGSIEVVRVLLDAGADINAQGAFEGTALRFAVSVGVAAIVELLVVEGADTEIPDVDGATPLYAAVVLDELSMVKILLEADADANTVAGDGSTALMRSAQLQTADIMKELLDANATVDAETPSGMTALHFASVFGTAEIVNLLLDAGADIEATTSSRGFTAVLYAAGVGNLETFDVLVARGADLKVMATGGFGVLHYAALAAKNTAVMEVLLDKGVDINATTEDGQTAIDLAAWIGDKPNIEFLLSKGASPSLNGIAVCGCLDVDDDSRCPPENCQSREDIDEINELLGVEVVIENLLQAVAAGDEEAVLRLINDGANVDETTTDGDTPLILASARGLEEIVTILLDAGADVNATDNIGLTPLLAASFFNHPSVVNVLIEADANIEAVMEDFGTSLHVAARIGSAEVIELLISAGADPDARNPPSESTPILFAAGGNHLEAVRALIDGGANATIATVTGLTALHMAATEQGSEKIMNILLGEGIDVNARTTEDTTPVVLAAYYGNKGAVLFLISRGADTQIGDGGPFDVVCGCVIHIIDPRLRQCAAGACRSQDDIDEIEALLGGDVPEAAIPPPGSTPPAPTGNSTDMPTLPSDAADCSSLPDVVAQLECVAALTAQPT